MARRRYASAYGYYRQARSPAQIAAFLKMLQDRQRTAPTAAARQGATKAIQTTLAKYGHGY